MECTISIFTAIVSGVSVFVIGQIILKLVIEPIQQLKKTMADISHTFIRYAYAIHNNKDAIPEGSHDEVFDKLRQLSGQLYGDIALIPGYQFLRILFCLPKKENIYESAKSLIGIANNMVTNEQGKFTKIVEGIQNVCDNLGLYVDPNCRISIDNIKNAQQ